MLFDKTMKEIHLEKEINEIDIKIKELELKKAQNKKKQLKIESNFIDLKIPTKVIETIIKRLQSENTSEEELENIVEEVESKYKNNEGYLEFNIEYIPETILEETPKDIIKIIKYHIILYSFLEIEFKELEEEISDLKINKIKLMKDLVNNLETDMYKKMLRNE